MNEAWQIQWILKFMTHSLGNDFSFSLTNQASKPNFGYQNKERFEIKFLNCSFLKSRLPLPETSSFEFVLQSLNFAPEEWKDLKDVKDHLNV